jgi:hypothetical protein
MGAFRIFVVILGQANDLGGAGQPVESMGTVVMLTETTRLSSKKMRVRATQTQDIKIEPNVRAICTRRSS